MLTKYDLKMPRVVFSGENALGNIGDILAGNDVKKLAVFTDKGIEGAGLLEFPMAVMTELLSSSYILTVSPFSLRASISSFLLTVSMTSAPPSLR